MEQIFILTKNAGVLSSEDVSRIYKYLPLKGKRNIVFMGEQFKEISEVRKFINKKSIIVAVDGADLYIVDDIKLYRKYIQELDDSYLSWQSVIDFLDDEE